MLLRVKSHRARKQMIDILGYLPVGMFSYKFPGEFRTVSDDEYELLKGVKGLTKARVDQSQLLQYLLCCQGETNHGH